MTADPLIDAGDFVASVQPLLEARDLEGLHCLLRKRWTVDQITNLLAGSDHDVRKVAALALALVGGKCCIPPLAERLRDPDPTINQMAEHALWSIWFRCGPTAANHQVARGAQAIHRMDYEHALEHFDRALEIAPNFAEAYNQRGIALYLLERYEDSVVACQRAVELMPCHFGAWSGLGHAHAHLGHVVQAIEAYERALDANPHLDCIGEAITELRKAIEPIA